ncbi:uncharacterized protein [Malus domestica]|uniref:uncharacterized protein n=1 Tax=Malus domestica TaxID=3750 RepID=UPI0010A9F881|nr:uncharacterized protein LOC103437895 [Malus domestica]
MDSDNSESMQSSSGGEDQDHEISRPNSIPGYLNSPTQLFDSSDPIVHPSLPSHYQNHNPQPTNATFFDHHISSRNYTYNHFHTALSQPQPNSSNPNFIPNSRSNQPNSTNPVPNPQPSSTTTQALLASSRGGQTNPVATRNTKKRTRASRRAPTTVLTTDTSNFRAMVQEFTGIPAPPFSASSSSPYARRLEMFGSGIRSPLHPLRPLAQKQPPPFHSSVSVPNFGARPSPRGVIGNLAMHSSLEGHLALNHHGSSPYVNTNQLGSGSIDDSHVAASDGNDGWRDHGVLGSSDGGLSSQDHHLRPSLDKCLEMNNVNSTIRGEGAVDSWISPTSDH